MGFFSFSFLETNLKYNLENDEVGKILPPFSQEVIAESSPTILGHEKIIGFLFQQSIKICFFKILTGFEKF